MFDQFFNAVFGPLAAMGPIYAIAGVALVISLISTGLYLVLINQQTLKRIKSEQKELQQKMKNAQKSKDEKALKDLFSSSMSLQHRMMVLTLKPMIASMVAFFLIIPWLSGTYGDISTGLENGAGTLNYNAISENVTVSDGTILVGDKSYAAGEKLTFAGKSWVIQYNEDDNKVTLQNVKFGLPFSFPLVGSQVGWLGIYIIISLPATMLFRKVLGVD